MYYGICNVVLYDLSLSANTFPEHSHTLKNDKNSGVQQEIWCFFLLLKVFLNVIFLYDILSTSFRKNPAKIAHVFCLPKYGLFVYLSSTFHFLYILNLSIWTMHFGQRNFRIFWLKHFWIIWLKFFVIIQFRNFCNSEEEKNSQ